MFCSKILVVILAITAFNYCSLMKVSGSLLTLVTPINICLENCVLCVETLGKHFNGPECAKWCLEAKGHAIPVCEDNDSQFINNVEEKQTKTEKDRVNICLDNCVQCVRTLGQYFSGAKCSDVCLDSKGAVVVDCEDTESIKPYLQNV